MNGDMKMDGSMKMDGTMDMSGQVANTMKVDNTASRLSSHQVYHAGSNRSQSRATVCLVDIDGLMLNKNFSGIGSMGENPVALFREKLDAVAADPNVAAIVLRINSPGGGVTATDIMTRDLLQLKLTRNLPVVACLMDVGTGGAYYLACAADTIVAHPTTVTGGVGVILNVYNLQDAQGQFGVSSMPVKAGGLIDMASPERKMEPTERQMLAGMARAFHVRFIDRVKQHRSPDIDEAWLDGRVFTGMDAKAQGFVDQVGYLDDAIVEAKRLANLPDDAPIVMFRRDNDRAFTLLDVTPNVPTMSSILPLRLPGLDRSTLPTFLYLWQPEPSMLTTTGG